MVKYRLHLIFSILITVLLVCYATIIYLPNSAYTASDKKAYSVDNTLVYANTKFAFKFFKEIVAEDTEKNVFVSPLSVSTILTMTYNGAEGTTKEAMKVTLGFGGMSLEDVDQGYSNLIDSLENVDKQVDMMIGNSIWINKGFEPFVEPSFIERVITSFKGETFTCDFLNPQTVDEINGWVDRKTGGKINDLIQQIDPEFVMFLVNAIYFKGDWRIKFDEAETRRQDFLLLEGDSVEVDMMSTSGKFSYYSGTDFQVARLPYGRDKIAMYIFLPHEDVPLDSFIDDLDQNNHEEYINRLSPIDDLVIELPKFKVEYGVKRLNSVLKKLGMDIGFNPFAANFSGIASEIPENLYISYVDHKAIVEVNEEGTEAAAATNVGIAVGSLPPCFTVNRPFFFEIRDDRSGSILFMGRVVNPSQG